MSGGAEAQIAYLAASLARMGHHVSLIYGDGGASGSTRVIGEVTCIDAAPAWRRPSSLPAFWQALASQSPELLYARLPDDFLWMLGLFALCHAGTRFLYQIANDMHCTPWRAYDYKRWFHAPVYAIGLWSADLVAVQHERQGPRLGRLLRDRVVRLPNLVRSCNDRPRPFGSTIYDAIWIAFVRPQKQLELFLDLAASCPELSFAVVGGFDPSTLGESEHARLVARMANLRNVAYLGAQRSEETLALLERSKVLVNTSRYEGFPNTMLEAWSLGVPVVSLGVDPGGVIGRERLGHVSGNDETLRHDVRALARSEQLNLQLGENGLSYARREHSLGALCAALEHALGGTRLAPVPAPLDETCS